MEANRRAVVTGLVASIVLANRSMEAGAEPVTKPLFAGTPLATNRVAGLFRRVDMPLPDIPVLTAAGRRRLPQFGGRPLLMTLWAEWCVPCLVEARDLAALRPQVADGRFDIVSVLTGSIGKLDYEGAAQRLRKAGAAGLTLLVEPDGGHAIAQALSITPPAPLGPPSKLPPGARIINGGEGFALPCTVLVDQTGKVRGRATGAAFATALSFDRTVGGPLTDRQKQAMLDTGNKTVWSTPAAMAFLTALRDGALDKV